ncbi:hypothetical protein A5760_17955 [Mycobacterium colombiense]|uniref:DUF732 domain-containing protein n=1 Tax=Mycobacterium colombiense TaxID=339268 RepID=A0A1A0VCG3_9MYCO|nr:DUF732 domain-containing protein [Mycobacterium colombiense]OBB80950.1 hypothetical protein A5760_17955 [Mycobacterium colombiense]
MFSTNHARALVTAIVVLTGVVMLPHGAAAADPNPDDQFVALLDQKEIPALENVPSLISTAHRICRQLDGGMPVNGVVDDMKERAFNANSGGGPYPPDRVMRTVARFISAAVEAYCPNNQAKIASISAMANPAPGSDEPSRAATSNTHHAALQVTNVAPASGPFALGETAQPEPPQLPPPPPPTAQVLTPPRPVAIPPPRQQPPPPQQGPQQEPPAAPAPGSPPGSGSGGGDDPESPPTPPGRVRLAP